MDFLCIEEEVWGSTRQKIRVTKDDVTKEFSDWQQPELLLYLLQISLQDSLDIREEVVDTKNNLTDSSIKFFSGVCFSTITLESPVIEVTNQGNFAKLNLSSFRVLREEVERFLRHSGYKRTEIVLNWG